MTISVPSVKATPEFYDLNARGVESEENQMPTRKFGDLTAALKKVKKEQSARAKKNETNLLWDKGYAGFIGTVEKLAEKLSDKQLRHAISEETRELLYTNIIALLKDHTDPFVLNKSDVDFRSTSYKKITENTANLTNVINKLITNNSSNEYATITSNLLSELADINTSLIALNNELRDKACTHDVNKYSDNISKWMTEADDLYQSGEVSEKTQKHIHQVFSNFNTLTGHQLLPARSKRRVAKAFHEYMRIYRDYLLTEEHRKDLIIGDVFSEFTNAQAALEDEINKITVELASSARENKTVKENIESLRQLAAATKEDFRELTAVSEKNSNQARDFYERDRDENFKNRVLKKENEKLFNQGYGEEKGQQFTDEQINFKKMMEAYPTQYNEVPYKDQMFELLGLKEEDLPEENVSYEIKGTKHTVNLRTQLNDIKRNAMNLFHTTAQMFIKDDKNSTKTEFLSLKQLEELDDDFNKFYHSANRFKSALNRTGRLPKGKETSESKMVNKIEAVVSPALTIDCSVTQAINYTKKYALRGEHHKLRLFSIYEMMGAPNPDLDDHFITQSSNVLDKFGKVIDKINDRKKKESSKTDKKEGSILKNKVEEKIAKIPVKLNTLLGVTIPDAFKKDKDDLTSYNKEKESILPFIDKEQVNELTKAYREAFLEMNEFMVNCEKLWEGEKVEGRNKMVSDEYELYTALLPVFKKVKEKYRLLTYLENPNDLYKSDDELGRDIAEYNRIITENENEADQKKAINERWKKEEVDFFKYALSCKEMYRTDQLMPQFLLDDHTDPRLSTILSMHKKKADIDYANMFEEKLTNLEWKDGKRDLSSITNDFKKHKMQLGTDDKIIQYALPKKYTKSDTPEDNEYLGIIEKTLQGFFPTEMKKEYNIYDEKSGSYAPVNTKITLSNGTEVEAGYKVYKYLEKNGEKIKNINELSGAFTKEELADEKVQKYLTDLGKKYKITYDEQPSTTPKSANVEIQYKDGTKKTVNIYSRLTSVGLFSLDQDEKNNYNFYHAGPNEKNGAENNGIFKEEELQNETIRNVVDAINRNLYNAGFGKNAMLDQDVPADYCEGDAKNAVSVLAPGLYPKVTMYDKMTLPFYMGQAMPDQVSNVKIGRVENNFSRTITHTKSYADCKPFFTTVNDFRKSDFVGDVQSKIKDVNNGQFEGMSDAELEATLRNEMDKPEKGFDINTASVRDYKSFDNSAVIKAAADLQVMDYLLGIPKRDVNDIRINFAVENDPITKQPTVVVSGISAADNGKLPFTAKKGEYVEPGDMRIISKEMAERIDRWSKGIYTPQETEQLNKLPEECRQMFKERVNVMKSIVKQSESVQWNDPIVNGELVQFGTFDTHHGHIRVLSDEQMKKLSMDDLAEGRKAAKNIAERETAPSVNIFDTLAKMPSACHESLVDKALSQFDVKKNDGKDYEKKGVFSNEKETWLGKRADDKTRDVLTRRFNRFETERLLLKTRSLESDTVLLNLNDSKEGFWHKLTGDSGKYFNAITAVEDLSNLIAAEHRWATKEQQFEKSPTSVTKEEFEMIAKRRNEREAKRAALAAEKGNDYHKSAAPIPVGEDPMLYHNVHAKFIDVCKKIETYLTSRAGASSEFGQDRLRGMVEIYNKLNAQIDEYAHLTGDTSYVPKTVTLNQDDYSVKFENKYENRYDFEMSLSDTVNREFKERENARKAKDAAFDVPEEDLNGIVDPKGLKQGLKKDRQKFAEEFEKRSSDYANVKHKPNGDPEVYTKKVEKTVKTGMFSTKKVTEDVEYLVVSDDFSTYDGFSVLTNETTLKLKKDFVKSHNELVKKDELAHPEEKGKQKQTRILADGMKNIKLESPEINVGIYEDMINITSEESKKEFSKYADPNSKEGRKAPAPKFKSQKEINAAKKRGEDARKIIDAKKKADEEKFKEEYNRVMNKNGKKKGMGKK